MQANRESLDANFASSNAAVFLGANRPVGSRGLRQDLEGFLSVERKGSGWSSLGRGDAAEKKIFPLEGKSRFTAQRAAAGSYLSRSRNDLEETRRFR